MLEDLHYQMLLTWSETEQVWVAEVPDLPECQATGPTAAQALEAIQWVMVSWLHQAFAEGRTPPRPQKLPLAVEKKRLLTEAKAEGYEEAIRWGKWRDTDRLAFSAYGQVAGKLLVESIATDNTQMLVELMAEAYQEGYREGAQEQGWTLEEVLEE